MRQATAVALAITISTGICLLVPAYAQPLIQEAHQVSQLGLNLVKAVAVLGIIVGIVSMAKGHHVFGGIGTLLCVIAAAKADTIASYFGIGA